MAPVLAERELNLAARRLRSLSACRVLCDYTAGVKGLMHRLKFRGDTRAAVFLTWLLTARFDAERLRGIDAVVPVPLHPDRLAERGYNQTELIFRRWSQSRGWPWLDVLSRVRPTAPQWELEPTARRRNIKGAFMLTRPEEIRGKTILLVDDIVTTGATLNECARVLRRGGAGKVVALALAGGQGSGR